MAAKKDDNNPFIKVKIEIKFAKPCELIGVNAI